MNMVDRGSSLGIAAGFLGIAAAGATLRADYMTSAFSSMPTITIDNSIGWLEALLSVFVIGFAQSSRTQPKSAAPLLLAVSLIGMLVGDGYAALCMLLATAGAILCLSAGDKSQPASSAPPPTSSTSTRRPPSPITAGLSLGLLAALIALFVTSLDEVDSDTVLPASREPRY
ncbi:MAG: hypothetical protein Q4E06_09545 [Lautropia sp.]|nr:hypothetical protein [Lautropia sp.]